MLQLLQNNYIKKSTGTKAKGYRYEVVSYDEYEQLQRSISSVLDQTGTGRWFSGSPVVQNENEPLEPAPVKKNGKKVQ